jgi:glycosyltransferase involved in cell wall biosynthesis
MLDSICTRTLARLADAVIVHSDTADERVRKAADLGREKLHVIPHGNYLDHYPDEITREEARNALGIHDEQVVFLLFGWIRKYKGVVELIRAFRALSAVNATLIVAGAVPEQEPEEAILAEADGNPRIVLALNAIADEDVQLYMNASDVAVFPYVPVLTSGAIVLAQSFGKACIVQRGSGLEGMAIEEGTIFYDGDADHGLARALETAIRKKDCLAEMGAHNRMRAMQHDWRGTTEQTIRIYERIVSRE